MPFFKLNLKNIVATDDLALLFFVKCGILNIFYENVARNMLLCPTNGIHGFDWHIYDIKLSLVFFCNIDAVWHTKNLELLKL